MRLLRLFTITSLLIAGIPRLAVAGVGAKSLWGLLASDECEVVPGLCGSVDLSRRYLLRSGEPPNKYWIVARDADSKTGKKLGLEICSAHIDGQLFYDATFLILGPDDKPTLPPEFVVDEDFPVDIVAGFWVPMHIIGKLEIEQNKLHFRNIDNEWLQVALKSHLITVASAQNDSGEYLLTANGRQLKAFVVSLSRNPKAFSEQLDLTRVPGRTLH